MKPDKYKQRIEKNRDPNADTKPKHRVYCPICQRAKMVFKSEEKALRFLQFNSEKFQPDYAPIRAYYCRGCAGWHLTHREEWRD